MGMQAEQHLLKMRYMVSHGRAVHEDIIEEDTHKFAHEGGKNLIHGCLERGQSIGQAEGHDKELIMTIMSSKRCFVCVPCVHPNLMIPSP